MTASSNSSPAPANRWPWSSTEAGGDPTDLVSMTIFTTDVPGYRESLGPIGEAYRHVFGKHFPPMALIGVAELFDPKAKVELVCTAVV